MLAEEGLVRREPRHGTSVTGRIVQIPMNQAVPPEPGSEAGVAPRVVITELERQLVDCPPVVRERLETPDLQVWMLEHLVVFDGRPISLRVTYCRESAQPDALVDHFGDLAAAFMAVHDEVMGDCSTTIEAIPCGAAASETLAVEAGSPILLQELLLRDRGGTAREVSYTHFRGDCVALSADLVSACPRDLKPCHEGA